jgi:charged multivesicular body protein 3
MLIFLQLSQDRLEDEQTDRNMEKYREQLNGLLST